MRGKNEEKRRRPEHTWAQQQARVHHGSVNTQTATVPFQAVRLYATDRTLVLMSQKDIRAYLATGRVDKQKAAKRAHANALSKVWRLEKLLDAAMKEEEDLLPAAFAAREAAARRAANLAQCASGRFPVIDLTVVSRKSRKARREEALAQLAFGTPVVALDSGKATTLDHHGRPVRY